MKGGLLIKATLRFYTEDVSRFKNREITEDVLSQWNIPGRLSIKMAKGLVGSINPVARTLFRSLLKEVAWIYLNAADEAAFRQAIENIVLVYGEPEVDFSLFSKGSKIARQELRRLKSAQA